MVDALRRKERHGAAICSLSGSGKLPIFVHIVALSELRMIRAERHFDGMATFRPTALAVTRVPVVTSLATRKGGAELPYPRR
jgi:hypothetical protein